MKALIHCWWERNSKQPLRKSVQKTLWKPKENYHVTSYTSGPGPKDSTSYATGASSKIRLSLLCTRLLRDGSGLSVLWQRDGVRTHMEHYPTEIGCKRTKFAHKRLELEIILLHEDAQTKKDKHHMFSHLQFPAPDLRWGTCNMEWPQKPGTMGRKALERNSRVHVIWCGKYQAIWLGRRQEVSTVGEGRTRVW